VLARLVFFVSIASLLVSSAAIAQPAEPAPTKQPAPAPSSADKPADQGSDQAPPPAALPDSQPPSATPAPPATAQPPSSVVPTPPPTMAEHASQPQQVGFRRNFAGSIQLDYMYIPTERTGRTVAIDGATAEGSLKIAMDFNSKMSASVKVCVACHGFEVGMAFFDVRFADELNFRAGRFTPSFGEFPLRHDPANHRTSDKPLIYDMGRMVRYQEWNEGILPSPWVDNGLEINGTHYFGDHVQMTYAAYAIGGPRGDANPTDFDYILSRDPNAYYADNNSRPVIGGQAILSYFSGKYSATVGASGMGGTYDPNHALPFYIVGGHFVLRLNDFFLRAEYLNRRTKMYVSDDPAEEFKYGPGPDGKYDPWFDKDGAYAELEIPLMRRLTGVLREDWMRRRGNVAIDSPLRSDSEVIRSTAGVAIAIGNSLRLKLSFERYAFTDFQSEDVIHVGIAGPF
jgi:hypothetical protein